ncbi:MAG: hypothetical protein IJH77_02375 [Mogibacterium sp.]|nr:hypothetical protein [Mogibacterium sp.]
MRRFRMMCEIIPGLMIGSAEDVEKMVRKDVNVLVPLSPLDSSIWKTGFRGEILCYPAEEYGVLPDEVLHGLVDKICDRLAEGRKVGIFSEAGYGSVCYVAACVLARHGVRDPIGFLRRNYSGKAVERDQQVSEVYSYVRGLRMEQIHSEGLGDTFFEYESYWGSEPYLYLSFSEWDHDVASETVRILNELGFRVAYDKDVLEGRLWSESRSDRIEDCSIFMEICTPCERYSHIRMAANAFAELMEKPSVCIQTDSPEWVIQEPEDRFIFGKPSDPDFADKCLEMLALNGLVPEPEPVADESTGRQVSRKRERKERKWDLGVTYYERYGDRGSGYRRERESEINCNLRTRETFGYRKKELASPSDEELYRAIGWKRIRFDLFTRGKRMNYISSEEDLAFRKRLCTLNGKAVPEIKREYELKQKKINDFWRDYPYMDEFEYVDSKFEDRD